MAKTIRFELPDEDYNRLKSWAQNLGTSANILAKMTTIHVSKRGVGQTNQGDATFASIADSQVAQQLVLEAMEGVEFQETDNLDPPFKHAPSWTYEAPSQVYLKEYHEAQAELRRRRDPKTQARMDWFMAEMIRLNKRAGGCR